jgi:hypothetical protein
MNVVNAYYCFPQFHCVGETMYYIVVCVIGWWWKWWGTQRICEWHLLWHCAQWDGNCDIEGMSALVGALGWESTSIHLSRVGTEIH